jgi:hypothetical protein
MNCIYLIINIINNKIYVGSTKNFKSRKSKHIYLLKNNKHPNFFLQNSWNKYGRENFIFKIIEENLKDKEILVKEQHYINELKVLNKDYGYNLAPLAGTPAFTNTEKIYQYDFNGSLINIYDNAEAPSKIYNCDRSGISACCRGKYRYYKNYVWIYEKDINTENVSKRIKKANSPLKRTTDAKIKMSIAANKRTDNKKPILQYDLGGNFIREWKSTKEAGNTLKISNGQLCDYLKGKHKAGRGFHWEYKK